MRPKNCLPMIVLAGLLMAVTAIIASGDRAEIRGIVTEDFTGDPVEGAIVVIKGTMIGAKSGPDGRFVLEDLKPGTITLKVTHEEFAVEEVAGVTLEGGRITNVAVKLDKLTTGDAEDKDEELSMVQSVNNPAIAAPVMMDAVAGKSSNMSFYGSPVPVQKMRDGGSGFPPAHGGTAIVNDQAFDAMFFKNYGVNPFVDTEDDHLSTFAIDVDDASYIMTRSYLDRGHVPPEEAIRTEEFINHFDYAYDSPVRDAFSIHFEGAPSEFGQNAQLLRIGIKGRDILPENRKDANLTFVIDVSGSMSREDRLGLVKKALRLLVDELTPRDRVGIVVYGSNGQVILEPTSLDERDRIIRAIESLQSGGSTFAEEGLRFGYRMAESAFQPEKINRVILCSDGVANVGRTGAEAILKDIKKFADKGITLSSIGFGMGNYNDILLEKLGNKGNGHYAYVDNLNEAKRIFVENLTGTLQVIARDVKIQVDFNPEVVRSYRLLGYENRDVDDADFRVDTVDGGEIGSGHEVTALYEIKFHKMATSGNVGTIFVRYKDPDSFEVSEVNRKIDARVFARSFESASIDFRMAAAAAEFAEILRKSYWAKGSELGDVMKVVKQVSNETESPDVIELMGLISKADQFSEELAGK